MTSTPDSQPTFRENLAVLLAPFPSGTTTRFVVYALLSVLVSLMDLLGLAVILPIMQVLLGEDLSTGYLGVVHRLLGEPSRPTFVLIACAFMVGAFLLKGLASLALSWWSSGFLAHAQIATSTRLLHTYMHDPYLDFRQRQTSEMMRRIDGSVADAHGKVLGGILGLFSSALSVVFILALLFSIMPLPTLAAVTYFALVVFGVQRLLAKANRGIGRVTQETQWQRTYALIEALSGFREITMHGAQKEFVDRFHIHAKANVEAGRRLNLLASLPRQIFEFTTITGIAVLLSVAVMTGSATDFVPTLSLFAVAIIRMLPSMAAISANIGSIQVGEAGLELTASTLRAHPALSGDSDEGAEISAAAPALGDLSIQLKDVSFRYPDGSSNVLTDVDLTIPRGTSVAFCGSSGSGKTTLVDVILGLFPPTRGRVTAGELDISASSAQWHKEVAYVPQDVYITDETIEANIAFGLRPEERDRRLIESCVRRAQLGDVVSEMPQGLETRAGERGARVSGGQRQRIGIARALYRKPSVLVLDEATSALDNETERKIADTIESLKGDITTIIVAHRLSTVRNVDQLVFMEDGRVSAIGTFDEVRAASPAFAKMVELGSLTPHVGERSPEFRA